MNIMRNVNKSKANRKFKADIFRPKKQDIILVHRHDNRNRTNNNLDGSFLLYVNNFKKGIPVLYVINEEMYTGHARIEKFDIISSIEYPELRTWDKADFTFTGEIISSNVKYNDAYDYVTSTLPEYFI